MVRKAKTLQSTLSCAAEYYTEYTEKTERQLDRRKTAQAQRFNPPQKPIGHVCFGWSKIAKVDHLLARPMSLPIDDMESSSTAQPPLDPRQRSACHARGRILSSRKCASPAACFILEPGWAGTPGYFYRLRGGFPASFSFSFPLPSPHSFVSTPFPSVEPRQLASVTPPRLSRPETPASLC